MPSLAALAEFYEIVIYSMAEENYVDAFTKFIDPEDKIISYALNRRHNVRDIVRDKYYKDLSILLSGRELKDIIIVDNSFSVVIQKENLIPISSFEGVDTSDTMRSLTNFLIQLAKVDDSTQIIKNDFVD